MKNIKLSEIRNIKNHHLKITQLMNPHIVTSNKIIDKINNYTELDFLAFREVLYELFIYNINIGESILYILSYFIKTNQLTKEKLCKIFIKLYPLFKVF